MRGEVRIPPVPAPAGKVTAVFKLSDEFRRTYPDTVVGMLSLGGIENPKTCPALDPVKEALEADIRARYEDKAAIKAEPVIGVYRDYYKRFKSTYHVLNQVHSIASKGRSIPRVAALVETMFMAELKNMVLTSGHDLDSLKPPLSMDVARGGEGFTMLAGKEASAKSGDIIFRDSAGIAGSIIHGPDKRTMIRPDTTRAMFVAWGVPDLSRETILSHLKDIEGYLKLISPGCQVEELEVVRG